MTFERIVELFLIFTLYIHVYVSLSLSTHMYTRIYAIINWFHAFYKNSRHYNSSNLIQAFVFPFLFNFSDKTVIKNSFPIKFVFKLDLKKNQPNNERSASYGTHLFFSSSVFTLMCSFDSKIMIFHQKKDERKRRKQVNSDWFHWTCSFCYY